MTQFISVPSKKGYEVKFIDAISNYVKETYGEDQYHNHNAAFIEFNNMRNKMLNKLFDKHESTIKVLTKYHDQFVALEGKIPLEENGIRIDFKWDDAFGKESVFGRKSFLKISSGRYERICVLFNIAALYSQVAETQNLSDDTGLKNSVKYFQQAAGIFSYLKSATPDIIEGEPTSDLNTDTLSTLSAVMVAQAQELIYTKSARDKMKEANVAKIIQQTADLYADTLQLMQLNSVKSIWPKEWIPLIASKQAGYHALAEYYQAKACGTNHAFGEQIARLKKSSELMKTASTRAGAKFMFRAEQERIRKDLETVEKENNMIYHDCIPEEASLSVISKAVLARELPLENPIDKDFKDLFSKIVPIALHSAMVMFQNKQKSMVDAEVYRLKEASNTLSGILASLNLPAALEENKGDEVPRMLLEKSAALRDSGGINKIEEMINSLPDVMRRNNDLLTESVRMLDDEEDSDKKLRDQFKDRWNRTPSGKLTESWRAESNKFIQILKQAKSSDEVIQKSYQEHSPQIRILSQNESVIKQSIPKSGSVKNVSDSSKNLKLEVKKLYDEIESLKATRNNLIQELGKIAESDIGSAFSKSINEDSSLNQEQLADEQINGILSPLRGQVRQSLDLQEQLLVKLQGKCSQWSGSEDPNQSRASVISSLMLAIDKYNELTNNLQEGVKFYGDLTDILLKFQNKVKDFCFARKTEKDELMKDLQSTIVREKTDVNSSGTNFQATSGGTDVNNQTSQMQYRPMPTYQANQLGVAAANSNVPPVGHPSPYMPPYFPAPYSQPYAAGGSAYGYQPQPGYPYQQQQAPPQGAAQRPQWPQQPGGQMPPYPSGYNYQTYPGYNQYYPR